MYVYTSGDRCVLDYLEGLKTMPDIQIDERNNKIRTAIFMDVILAYLDYQRNYGIKWCHLFASTPKYGSVAYIFNHLPNPDTRPVTARQNSLMGFYHKSLNIGKNIGIIKRISNVHEELVNIARREDSSLLDIWCLEDDFWINPEIIR